MKPVEAERRIGGEALSFTWIGLECKGTPTGHHGPPVIWIRVDSLGFDSIALDLLGSAWSRLNSVLIRLASLALAWIRLDSIRLPSIRLDWLVFDSIGLDSLRIAWPRSVGLRRDTNGTPRDTADHLLDSIEFPRNRLRSLGFHWIRLDSVGFA